MTHTEAILILAHKADLCTKLEEIKLKEALTLAVKWGLGLRKLDSILEVFNA